MSGRVRRLAVCFPLVCATLALPLVAGCSQPKPGPQPQGARPAAPPVITSQQPVALSEIHREAGEVERVWHLRAALNVAALQCARSSASPLVKDYNLILARHRTVLAQAYAAKQARFQAAGGKAWQQAMDRHLPRLYNHWAWPPAQDRFCAAAAEAARRASLVAPDGFAVYALRALAAVDQPIALTQGSSIRLVSAKPAQAPVRKVRLSAKK
jgi:hypothetical protein